MKATRNAIREHDDPDFLREDVPSDYSDFTKETRTTSSRRLRTPWAGLTRLSCILWRGLIKGFAMLVVRAEDGEPHPAAFWRCHAHLARVEELSLATVKRKHGPFSQHVYTRGTLSGTGEFRLRWDGDSMGH